MLEIQHISKTFHPNTIHAKKALVDLSLRLEDGDFATVIGGNGAGKSTLLNAIAGSFPVDTGKIALDGVDMTAMDEHARALKAIHSCFPNHKEEPLNNDLKNPRTIALVGLFAALSYIGFQFLRIDIPVGTEKTAFHMGNIFLFVAALLFGGLPGGLAGSIGMTIADVTGGYLTAAPATFIIKLFIGLIAGGVAGKVGLRTETDPSRQRKKAALAIAAGALSNLILDPIIRYFYNSIFYGLPGDLASKLAAIGSMTTLVNGLVAIIVGTIVYVAVRRSLKR